MYFFCLHSLFYWLICLYLLFYECDSFDAIYLTVFSTKLGTAARAMSTKSDQKWKNEMEWKKKQQRPEATTTWKCSNKSPIICDFPSNRIILVELDELIRFVAVYWLYIWIERRQKKTREKTLNDLAEQSASLLLFSSIFFSSIFSFSANPNHCFVARLFRCVFFAPQTF